MGDREMRTEVVVHRQEGGSSFQGWSHQYDLKEIKPSLVNKIRC